MRTRETKAELYVRSARLMQVGASMNEWPVQGRAVSGRPYPVRPPGKCRAGVETAESGTSRQILERALFLCTTINETFLLADASHI